MSSHYPTFDALAKARQPLTDEERENASGIVEITRVEEGDQLTFTYTKRGGPAFRISLDLLLEASAIHLKTDRLYGIWVMRIGPHWFVPLELDATMGLIIMREVEQ